MTSAGVVQSILPANIALLIFGIGMSLSPADFTRLVKTPRAAIAGLFNQTLVLPLIAFGLLFAFDPEPELALGLLILAASPSATTSNLFTWLARGDVALSITITSASKVLSVFTLPLALGAGMGLIGVQEKALSLSFTEQAIKLAWMILLPLAAGMALRRKYPGFALRAQPWVKRLAVAFLVVIVIALVIREHELIADRFLSVAPAAVTLCLLGMASGQALCALLNLPEAQRTAIVIDSMMQSGGVAMVIAIGLTGSTAAAMPAAMYSLFMYLSAAVFVLYRNFFTGGD